MMACYPFFDDEKQFGSTIVDYKEVAEEMKKRKVDIGRRDPEWERWQDGSTGVY